MRLDVRFLLASVALCAASVQAQSLAPAASHAQTPLQVDGAVRLALLDPDTPTADRATALQSVVTLANAGSADAAFQLGVLYRSGPEHPSRATPRDADTARHWLERCIALPACPTLVLASLAELELTEHRAERAMQWAQASALVERELARRRQGSAYAPAKPPKYAYNAALIQRVFLALPRADDRDAQVIALLKAFLATNEPALVRMIDAELQQRPSALLQFDPASTKDLRVNAGPKANYGLFLMRSAPAGGLSDIALMVEGVPTPRESRTLATVVRRLRLLPYEAQSGETWRYALAPISLDDGRFKLKERTTE